MCRCDAHEGETAAEFFDRYWPFEEPRTFHGQILQFLSSRRCDDDELMNIEVGWASLYLMADTWPDMNFTRRHYGGGE